MARMWIGAAAVLAAAAGAQAQDETYEIPDAARTTAESLMDAALDSDLAYGLLESLTTEIGPRLAGSPQEARAREWGVAKLEELGFENVRVETFELDYWVRGREEAEIVAPFPQKLHVTALGGSGASPAGGVTAEVVRFATFDDLVAAPANSLTGKIAYVDDTKMVRSQEGAGYGYANRKRGTAWIEAQERGAVAVLIRSVGTDNHRVPHTGAMSRLDEVPFEDRIPAAALSAPDADQLARAVAMADGPVTVKLTLTPTAPGAATSGNVIGEIVGREAPEEIVIIGGHLDSWDLGTGAIDDGAGVAITMAAAKLIGDLDRAPRRTIRVVLFGSEETGLHGGRAYAEAHADDLADHVIGAESDFGAGRIWQFRPGVGESALPAANAIASVIAPLGVIPGPNTGGGGPDLTFLRLGGMPVASLMQDGTDYFDLHHTPDDTLDKVDPAAVRQNVAAYAAFAYLAAELDVDFRDPPAEEGSE